MENVRIYVGRRATDTITAMHRRLSQLDSVPTSELRDMARDLGHGSGIEHLSRSEVLFEILDAEGYAV